MTVTRPAMRYHGAKFRLAGWIQQFFPAHQCYVEPFGGAAGVLLQKPRSYAEVYNDLDGDIVNFFRVLQAPDTRARLLELVQLTPYARAEFDLAWEPTDDPVERARRTAIRAQMGFAPTAATAGSAGFRANTTREYSLPVNEWTDYPQSIAAAGQRFTGVIIENGDASRVMSRHDAATTLHFVDPPYVHETRVRPSRARNYRHEMTDADHLALLAHLAGLRGMVVLCGYDSDLYNDNLPGWKRHATAAYASGQRGAKVRTEVVWLNPACADALARECRQPELLIA